MPRFALLVAALLLAGCQSRPVATESTATTATTVATAPAKADASLAHALTARAWSTSDPATPAGTLLIFTADGTLLMDSCFETYRLCRWSMASDSVVTWQEDGVEIRATIVAADAEQLTLRLALKGGDAEQHFRAATVPFTCPDMPK